MNVLPVPLEQVVSGLRPSLHSIDIRAAVSRLNSGWQSALTGLRISPRPVEAVKQRYIELEGRFGKRQTESFKVLLQAFPLTELDRILSELARGSTAVEGEQIPFSGERRFDGRQGWIQRYHQLVRPWEEESWPAAYYSAGKMSAAYHQPEIIAAIRGSLGLASVEEMVDAFLGVRGSSTHDVDVFIHIQMPARIRTLKAVGRAIEVHVVAENSLRCLQLFLSRKDSRGTTLLEHQELGLEQVGSDGLFNLLRAKGQLSSVNGDDLISCVLTHESQLEIDEETGGLRKFMPAVERNPLLECLEKFWNMEKLYQQIERPYETGTRKVRERPQDAFQKSVARLLNLAGFQAIDLEREDQLRHPETNVGRATIDILAYHPGHKILLLGACTINPPKAEDFEKLLHAKAILGSMFSSESPMRLTPVLFSGQENVSPFKGEATTQGLRILNAGDLAVFCRLVESGEEERFLHFLESPFDTELREKSVWEA